MAPPRIERLTRLEGAEELAAAARKEGFAFLDRLLAEWADGTNRFSHEDEILYGAFIEDCLIGTAGLTLQRPRVGRIRRVYVHPDFRRQGIAAALMGEVLLFSAGRYSELVLFTETPEAFRLYERLGFVPEGRDSRDYATHRRIL